MLILGMQHIVKKRQWAMRFFLSNVDKLDQVKALKILRLK